MRLAIVVLSLSLFGFGLLAVHGASAQGESVVEVYKSPT